MRFSSALIIVEMALQSRQLRTAHPLPLPRYNYMMTKMVNVGLT